MTRHRVASSKIWRPQPRVVTPLPSPRPSSHVPSPTNIYPASAEHPIATREHFTRRRCAKSFCSTQIRNPHSSPSGLCPPNMERSHLFFWKEMGCDVTRGTQHPALYGMRQPIEAWKASILPPPQASPFTQEKRYRRGRPWPQSWSISEGLSR